jgi:hypothetical protein
MRTELAKVAPGLYLFALETDCRSFTAGDNKLTFLFKISCVGRWWIISQPIGALQFTSKFARQKSLKAAQATILSAVTRLITSDLEGVSKWAFWVNSGGFFTATFEWRGWQFYASFNPRDPGHEWDVTASMGHVNLQARSGARSFAILDVMEAIRKFEALPKRKIIEPVPDLSWLA